MTPRALLDRLLSRWGALPKRPAGSRGKGWDWERIAERHLVSQGYRILERNLRLAGGEIDLVAEEKGWLCFVEVKGRSGSRFGEPAEAVGAEKQRRLARLAEAYRRRSGREDQRCRFDVVSVRAGPDGPAVELWRDAFAARVEPRR